MENLRINSMLATLSTSKVSKDERSQLIHEGSALVLERVGRARNAALVKAGKPSEDFGSSFKSNGDYEAYAKKWSDDVLCFCAKQANDFAFKETNRDDRSTFTRPGLATDPFYLRTLAGIIQDIEYGITPYLISSIVDDMCSVVRVPKGQTYELEITSNAVIQFEDTDWLALRSVPQDQLYNETITLNPKPFAARAVVNYYQMVGNGGNLVDTIAALAGGYAAKVMEKFTTAFLAAAGNSKYVPASLAASGYTDANWAQLCQNVAKANRVRRDQLIAYGDFMALRKVLPDNASLASAIMMQMGQEYFRNGYLMSHDSVMLYEIGPTSTPDTINTTMTSVFPTDMIVIAARANARYAPMVMAWEDNADTMVELTPGEDTIATGRIEVLQVASAAIAPAFAAKVGIMSSIV